MPKTCLARSINNLLVLILLVAGCGSPPPRMKQTPYEFQLPEGFDPPPVPAHNPMTQEKITLGRKLFFDPILSADSTISCGTCHQPELAFANHDIVALGIGGHGGMRNVPTLVNVAYFPYLFAEGEVPDLETQAIAPVQHENEMGFNLRKAITRINADKEYRRLFYLAFDTLASTATLVRALACYERTLISANSPYDAYLHQRDSSRFSAEARRGMKLFFSERTHCASCHFGNLLTNFAFENIGLHEFYPDMGKKRATELPEDEGKFKVPTLRNVALTAPYMHDGSMKTLEDVVEFYNRGGSHHPNKNPLIHPLRLTEEEKKDMVAFLQSLTDTNISVQEGIFSLP